MVLLVVGVVLGLVGLAGLVVAGSALGNASRFGVPAPLRWRRIRLAGALVLLVGVVLAVLGAVLH